MNSRLDTLQAAVLLEKLKFFDEEVEMCNQVAMEYARQLRNTVKVPIVKEGMLSSWAQYTICFQNDEGREKSMKSLKKKGIPTAVYYRKPMHKQEAFRENRIGELESRISEKICDCCLSLPMHPYLSMDDVRNVADKVRQSIEYV